MSFFKQKKLCQKTDNWVALINQLLILALIEQIKEGIFCDEL